MKQERICGTMQIRNCPDWGVETDSGETDSGKTENYDPRRDPLFRIRMICCSSIGNRQKRESRFPKREIG